METRLLAWIFLIPLVTSCDKKSNREIPMRAPSGISQADNGASKWRSNGRNHENGSNPLSSLEEEDIENESAKFQSWSVEDLDEYLETFDHSLSQENAWLYGIALDAALLKDESRFAARFLSLLPESYRKMGFFVSQLFVKHHPDLLARKVEGYDFGNQEERGMLRSVWSGLYENDPERATKLIENSENQWGAGVVAFVIAGNDPGAAFRFASSLSNGSQRSEALVAAVQKTVQSSPAVALELLKSAPYEARAWQALFDNWMKQPNPQAAIDEFGKLPKDRQALLLSGSSFVEVLARESPQTIVDALESKVLTTQNVGLFKTLFAMRKDQSLSSNLDDLRSFAESPSRNEIIAAMAASSRTLGDVDAFIGGLASFPVDAQHAGFEGLGKALGKLTEDKRQVILGRLPDDARNPALIGLVSEVPPAEAISLLASNWNADLSDSSTNRTLNQKLLLLGQKLGPSGTEALKSLNDIPDQMVPVVRAGIFRSWAAGKPDELAEWLSAHPKESSYEAGAKALIHELEQTDPENATLWRNSLESNKSMER